MWTWVGGELGVVDRFVYPSLGGFFGWGDMACLEGLGSGLGDREVVRGGKEVGRGREGKGSMLMRMEDDGDRYGWVYI